MSIHGGIYEFTIGVSDFDPSISFWESCGYHVGLKGELSSEHSKKLYDVDANLESIRMNHQNASAGLVRLMKWDKPLGEGLNMAPLRSFGNRWSVHKTDNIANAYVHGEVLRQQGHPINLVGPHYNLNLDKKVSEKKPFKETLAATGELLLFQPEAQLVIMSRMNFSIPKYGTINQKAPLRVSEGCHMAIVLKGNDKTIFDFYEDVIGLKRYRELNIEYQPGYMPSDMFNLKPGETLTELNFDDPKSGTEPEEHLPGRLRCFMVSTKNQLPDLRTKSTPGNKGYTFYTLRASDIKNMFKIIELSHATGQTDICINEFGEDSFYFLSPDGFSWVMQAINE